MQALKINTKFFRSVRAAAKFLGVSTPWLCNQLKGKQAITHKDLLIEKTKEERRPVKRFSHKMARIPVLVDGMPYNSCSEAELELKIPPTTLARKLRAGKTIYKGHRIEPVYRQAPRNKAACIKVLCETTGVTYNSISDAARVAKADTWTMSKKMEFAGSFVDAKGNVYKRLEPMKTKNVYNNTGSTVTREVPFVSRKSKTTVPVNITPAVADLVKQNEEKVTKKPDVPQIVKDAITEKIVKILKDKGCYEEIIDLLNYGGFATIKLVND